MQDRQNSNPILGINASGEERKYVFKLLDAEKGTELFHRYAGVMAQVHDSFVAFLIQLMEQEKKELSKDEEIAFNLLGTSDNVIFVIKQLPSIFTWEIVSGLAKELLANHVVTIDEKEYTANENGFTEKGNGDPLEMYSALLYAVEANYPKYINPLKLRMVKLFSEDSTQDSNETEQKRAPKKAPKK